MSIKFKLVSLGVVALLFIGTAVSTSTTNNHIKTKFNELKNKSEAHREIVTAYRECRDLTSNTRSDCKINAAKYGEFKGYKKESMTVINDIEILVDHLKGK